MTLTKASATFCHYICMLYHMIASRHGNDSIRAIDKLVISLFTIVLFEAAGHGVDQRPMKTLLQPHLLILKLYYEQINRELVLYLSMVKIISSLIHMLMFSFTTIYINGEKIIPMTSLIKFVSETICSECDTISNAFIWFHLTFCHHNCKISVPLLFSFFNIYASNTFNLVGAVARPTQPPVLH